MNRFSDAEEETVSSAPAAASLAVPLTVESGKAGGKSAALRLDATAPLDGLVLPPGLGLATGGSEDKFQFSDDNEDDEDDEDEDFDEDFEGFDDAMDGVEDYVWASGGGDFSVRICQ
jgi:hypothetical protein